MPHTPGPWQQGATKITVSLTGFDVWAVPISGSGSAIGCAYAGSVGRQRNVDVELANARLMAAAPDLLSALQVLLQRAISDGYDSILTEQARAAIAKATGGQ